MLILGSNSTARYELLRMYNAEITVMSANIDETFDDNLSVESNVTQVAYKKAKALKPLINEEDILICADTVCVCNNKVLTKPQSYEEAFAMFMEYSNNEVEIITGVNLIFDNKEYTFSETSTITFPEISEQLINRYLEEVTNYQKVAGAICIEKLNKYLEYTYSGSYSNIIGLPMEIISELLFDRNILNYIDYETPELSPIGIYRSSIRVLPIKDDKVYLLQCYTSDKKELFYLSIGGGYNYFDDKEESLRKESKEEAGFVLSDIQFLINAAEYNRNEKELMRYNKLTTHAYYSAEIVYVGHPEYVEYENELIIGAHGFDIEEAKEMLERQHAYFIDKPYPVKLISLCDLEALKHLDELKKGRKK